MRSHWLLLGMLIPVALTVAFWQRDVGAEPERGIAALYLEGGAKLVTADVDALIEQGAPPSERDAAPPRPAWLDPIVSWLPEPTPRDAVLVILVEGPERVAIARRGVSDERIAAESPEAFVVGEDRMVAGSRDAAAEMLLRLDWVDRPLELFAVESRRALELAAKGTRNADAQADPLLDDAVATEVAQVHTAETRGETRGRW